MSKKTLVIVESPAKAKTINKYLGADYVVKASMGHVRDLPPKKLGVDIKDNFTPEYIPATSRTKTIAELRAAAKDCDAVILAPDPDREGESIAWHLFEVLKDLIPEDKFSRVTYNEITKKAIQEAFAHPGELNMNRVNSQQARRVLDRIVGFQVSPLLWKQIKGGVSAGRVQSVALRLVCEREQEIRNFTPEEFWLLGANVKKLTPPVDPFFVKLAQINGEKAEVKSGDVAAKIRTDLEKSSLHVARIIQKEIQRKARAPFITSTLQQSASSVCAFSPSRTMSIAQSLYENGLITYMRTDSFNIAQSAQEACRAFVTAEYGAEYLSAKPNFYKSRASAQEAHEAIRPTDVTQTPAVAGGGLKPEEQKLYKLIWERFVASQMVPAKIARRTAEIETNGSVVYLFRATSSEISFPGYMRASGIEKPVDKKNEDDEDENDEVKLPPLKEGEVLDCIEWTGEQKFTKPPARYSEPALIRTLEENGVGRPSTYAQTLAVLDKRDYVTKEKRSLVPTDAGMRVNEFLVGALDALFNVSFTAEMEEKLDKIEEGSVEWTDMMTSFYNQFLKWLDGARDMADPDETKALLAAFSHIQNWAEPVKRGRRTYDDQEIIKSVQDKFDKDGQITARQHQMLERLASKYIDQLEADAVKKLNIEKQEGPREETISKLQLLSGVTFGPARKTARRTYDDAKFYASLQQQVSNGRRLSDRQIEALDGFLLKYSDQIEGFANVAETFNLTRSLPPESGVIKEMLGLLENNVKEWNPPVKRGSMEFSDEKFFESLAGQFGSKGTLTDKQVNVLKKIIARYAKQIPDYDTLREKYELPDPNARAKKKAAKDDE